MLRFVTEQYSEGLPVGCMLGYVLDGNVAKAAIKVDAAISANSSLTNQVGLKRDLDKVSNIERFATDHKRALTGTQIELRHSLVSCT